jgi:hypothetical protein
MQPTVTDIKSEVLMPKVPAKYAIDLPKKPAVKHGFTINNVNASVASAIRRACSCEIPVIRMNFDIANMETDDKFLNPDIVKFRVQAIPLMQNCPVKTTFLLDVKNDSTMSRVIRTGSIIPSHGTDFFEDNIELVKLNRGCFLRIPIRIDTGHPNVNDEEMAVVAFQAASYALDVEPFNQYTLKGVSSTMADPRQWRVQFVTNGTISLRELMKKTCDNIIERMRAIQANAENFILTPGDEPEYQLELNETATIGELWMGALELFPDIPIVAFKEERINEIIILRCRCDNINDVVSAIVRTVVAQITAINSYF